MEAAREVRDLLRQRGLESFIKTTGGKGSHVVTPTLPDKLWPGVKAFTHLIAASMKQDLPDRYTTNIKKAARKGCIFVDFLRSERMATAVAPFSRRGKERLSQPAIGWAELPPPRWLLRGHRIIVRPLAQRGLPVGFGNAGDA